MDVYDNDPWVAVASTTMAREPSSCYHKAGVSLDASVGESGGALALAQPSRGSADALAPSCLREGWHAQEGLADPTSVRT